MSSPILTYRFTLLGLFLSVFVVLIASIGAFINNSISLTIITFSCFSYLIFTLYIRAHKSKNIISSEFNSTPIYLICIPLMVMLIRFMFLPDAVEWSRNQAIINSSQLIRDIETFHQRNGNYPVSLLSLWEDYKPNVKGVKRYQYELNGRTYNLFFEQFSVKLGSKEIVMYNKLDEHEMTSHNQDLLLLTSDQLNQQRGYFLTRNLPNHHWKYFWFD